MNLKKIARLAIFVLVLLSSCYKNPSTTLLQQKGKAQTEMLQLLQAIDAIGELDLAIVKDYIAKAEEFGTHYPEEPMAPDFLYKAGLLAMTVAKTSQSSDETAVYTLKALTLFDDIQRIYPDFNGIKNCIINKGMIYDDILHDYENAEIFYREFIARYPTDTLAINIESYLPYLGKTPEEIISELGQ